MERRPLFHPIPPTPTVQRAVGCTSSFYKECLARSYITWHQHYKKTHGIKRAYSIIITSFLRKKEKTNIFIRVKNVREHEMNTDRNIGT